MESKQQQRSGATSVRETVVQARSWLAARTVGSSQSTVRKLSLRTMRAIRVVLGRTPFWGASVSKDAGYVADLLADDRRSIAPFEVAGRALPRISIVVPNFNQGRFLEACLTSILDQDYPDFEVVMVDGGSTDESREIIERYADRLTWWVIERDEGQADAINKGLRRCTGQVVNWVNADDRLTPGALRGIADAYLDHPAAAAWIGGCIRTDEEGAVADIILYSSSRLCVRCAVQSFAGGEIAYMLGASGSSGGAPFM